MNIQLTVKENRANTNVKLMTITYNVHFIISNTQSIEKPYFIKEGEVLEQRRND